MGPEELSLLDTDQDLWWDSLDEHSKFRIAMGLAWEEWYIPQIPEVVDHPGEFELDGVFMTHDGEELCYVLSEQRHQLRVHEVKFTYKSTKTVGLDPATALQTQWMWVTQVKGYSYALGTNLASIHVLFACGDYKFPIRPQGWRYDIEFNDYEMDSNWSLMTDYRDLMLFGDREDDV